MTILLRPYSAPTFTWLMFPYFLFFVVFVLFFFVFVAVVFLRHVVGVVQEFPC